jgi:hypothetical protein
LGKGHGKCGIAENIIVGRKEIATMLQKMMKRMEAIELA